MQETGLRGSNRGRNSNKCVNDVLVHQAPKTKESDDPASHQAILHQHVHRLPSYHQPTVSSDTESETGFDRLVEEAVAESQPLLEQSAMPLVPNRPLSTTNLKSPMQPAKIPASSPKKNKTVAARVGKRYPNTRSRAKALAGVRL